MTAIHIVANSAKSAAGASVKQFEDGLQGTELADIATPDTLPNVIPRGCTTSISTRLESSAIQLSGLSPFAGERPLHFAFLIRHSSHAVLLRALFASVSLSGG